VASVQIILNAFRRKPLDRVLPAAAAAGVGIIARVPLASGLLSGRYTKNTTFAADDHRSYNAHGEAFDVGETFSGVGLEAGADAAAEFAAVTGGLPGGTPAQWALRWVIQQPGVTTVIPGARNTAQARQNAEAASLPPLPQAELGAIEAVRQVLPRHRARPLVSRHGNVDRPDPGNPVCLWYSRTLSITIKYRYRAQNGPIGTKLGR
jgi:Predicted oxidoreductases (related to aryl-alcohol dehydrogenases)